MSSLEQNSIEIMANGSKSFTFAARLLPAWQRKGAQFLYFWCRYCDDVVDNSNADDRKYNLEVLERETKDVLLRMPEKPVFRAFRDVLSSADIPLAYPSDLLKGMRLDLEGQRYQSLQDLEMYCYYVAGTVGLMMCHVMGVSDTRALQRAVDLGIAMQLTNIARDVREDHGMGRVYLPLDWLEEEKIPAYDLMNPRYRAGLVRIVERLLRYAEEKYGSGESGLCYLHWRSALAIRVASRVYAGIGHRVLQLGPRAWDGRVYTSRTTKFWLAGKALLAALKEVPWRLRHPWHSTPLEVCWQQDKKNLIRL